MAEDPKSPSPAKLSPKTETDSPLSQTNLRSHHLLTIPVTQNSDAQGQLHAAVDDLLNELQSKFDNVSTEMFSKLDDMTKRLDDLEASLIASSSAAPPTPSK
ncbi:uncharacterized protein N7529_002701 [Penicillium soppii]|uniref:uncharacterized protein n=1 Tax=Penicillium soppii TaxID=69789 RepID=UPI002547537B|nr:uncharacterized protein N7529_002701 [Penicillium soppii]KAJ5874271.1 hypothetical protein N7529_002701 [Penicillium soppii]